MSPIFITYNRGSGGHFVRALIASMYDSRVRPLITINGNSNILYNYVQGWESNQPQPDGSVESSIQWLDGIILKPEDNPNIIIPCHVRHVNEIRSRFPDSKIIYLHHRPDDLYLIAKAWFVKVLIDEFDDPNTKWDRHLYQVSLLHPEMFTDTLLPWTLSPEQLDCFLTELVKHHFKPNEFLKLDYSDANLLQLDHYDVLLPNRNLIEVLSSFIEFPKESIQLITYEILDTWHSRQPQFIQELIRV